MQHTERPWDFEYRPPPSTYHSAATARAADVVIGWSHARREDAEQELRRALPITRLEVVLDRAPLLWLRASLAEPIDCGASMAALERLTALRFVAPATFACELLPRPCTWVPGPLPSDWVTRDAPSDVAPATDGHWFLDAAEGGVGAIVAGLDGAGTRLAVIDDDLAFGDWLALDAVRHVEAGAPARHEGAPPTPKGVNMHGSLMVAWAVGTKRGFRGVAPAASPRVYLVPHAGVDVLSVPLAIVQAVGDGADVIVCSTYVDGTSSPMLDDALELARRQGRGGRGTLVVLPTGRAATSPRGSVHSSWTLDFGDPASDPRVLCVGPSARGGGWFHWLDRKHKFRPFANRGPAVRCLAPGDDMGYPFSTRSRLFHAESSGASAVAAGVALLVLAANPALSSDELMGVLCRTARAIDPAHPGRFAPLADAHDEEPKARDRDGHNAKHGYGMLDAWRAVATVSDPFAAALTAIGEDDAARRWLKHLPWSARLARKAAQSALADAHTQHALAAFVRHLRLVAGAPERQDAHAPQALKRQLYVIARRFAETDPYDEELRLCVEQLRTMPGEMLASGLHELAACMFQVEAAPRSGIRREAGTSRVDGLAR